MPDESLRASVVIPVRNGAAVIGIQLAALAAQSVTDFEVIVSDNGSTDGTKAAALAWQDRLPHLRIVDSSQQAGVSHARNIGASHARSDKVLFCDADDEADQGWVAAMSEGLERFDLVGGVVSTVELNEAHVRAWTDETGQTELPNTLRYLPYAVGANLGVTKVVMERLSGFDTSFVGGHEEVDFAWRLQRSGGTIGFLPEARMHYRLRSTIPGLAKQRFAYGRSNALLQARYRDQPGLPPFTIRRQVRILLSVLRGASAIFRAEDRGRWVGGLAWSWGRLIGRLQYANVARLSGAATLDEGPSSSHWSRGPHTGRTSAPGS